jgi:putative FmdB family regulatory protein
MPLFEFTCQQCGWEFEELLRSSDTSEVSCPACDSQEVSKKISSFASKISGSNAFSASFSSSASCNTGGT